MFNDLVHWTVEYDNETDFNKLTIWKKIQRYFANIWWAIVAPEFAHDYILEMQNKYPDLISIENATIIANAILCHMGKWSHFIEFTKGNKAYPLPASLFEYGQIRL